MRFNFSRIHPISLSPYRRDHAPSEGLFDLGAEAADVYVHAVTAALQKGGEGVTGNGSAAVGHQAGQDGPLGGCQGNTTVTYGNGIVGQYRGQGRGVVRNGDARAESLS
jgi:hypothetical protein